MVLATIILISALAGLIIASLITRSVTQPLQEALGVAENVAKGDLTSEIYTDRKDETGQLLSALNNMNSSLRQIVSGARWRRNDLQRCIANCSRESGFIGQNGRTGKLAGRNSVIDGTTDVNDQKYRR